MEKMGENHTLQMFIGKYNFLKEIKFFPFQFKEVWDLETGEDRVNS